MASEDEVSFTANTLELLDAAMVYVVEKALHATGITIMTGVSTAFTLLDRMAMFMARAAKVSAKVSIWVYHLIKKMARLIGVKVKEGTDLTVAFIRTVFLRVQHKISDMVWRIGREVDK